MQPSASTTDPRPLSASPDNGPRSRDPLDWEAHGLSPRARRIVHAYAEAMFADGDDAGTIIPATPEVCARATTWLDHASGRASSDLRRGLNVLAWLLELLPLFVIGAFSRMSRLPVARRVAYLEALEKSRLGLLAMLLLAFKIPLGIVVFEEGEELTSTGFDRPSTTTRRRLPVVSRESSS